MGTEYQPYADAIVVYFSDFSSNCEFGIHHFQWAVGTSYNAELLMKYTQDGLIVDFSTGMTHPVLVFVTGPMK